MVTLLAGLGVALDQELPIAAPIAEAAALAQREAHALTDAAGLAWQRHTRAGEAVDALRALEQEHAEAQLELLRLRALEREHGELLSLMELEHVQPWSGVGARVIAQGTGSRQTLRLDIGTDRGVRVGQPVIAPGGVVGQVVAVGVLWSDVLALTDPAHGVQGDVENGPWGAVRGAGDGLTLEHLVVGTGVDVGATVRTTGLGDAFPPGLPLGVVRDVREVGAGAFLRIDVAPAVAWTQLRTVLVLTGHPGFGQRDLTRVDPASLR